MKDNKKVKFTRQIKSIGSRLKWILFSEIQDLKLSSKYIDLICPDSSEKVSSSEKLRDIVEDAVVKEFTPSVKNMKCYDTLVDAVTHNLKQKSLGEKE